jgi:hypothetical protein
MLAHTIVALVSDHGENLGEHGVQCRHPGLFDTTTHVPLLVRWPGETRSGRRIAGLVQHLDLFPTLLRAAGLEPPPSDGLDLRELTGEGRPGRRAVFAEHSEHLGEMVRTASASLFRSRGESVFFRPGDYVYDLRRDPHQEQNLAGAGSADESALASLLDRWLADHRGAAQPPARPAKRNASACGSATSRPVSRSAMPLQQRRGGDADEAESSVEPANRQRFMMSGRRDHRRDQEDDHPPSGSGIRNRYHDAISESNTIRSSRSGRGRDHHKRKSKVVAA